MTAKPIPGDLLRALWTSAVVLATRVIGNLFFAVDGSLQNPPSITLSQQTDYPRILL